MSNEGEERVSKLLAARGICSRREADSYIERGWVRFANGGLVMLGMRAAPNAEFILDPRAQTAQAERVTILLNKPVGYVSGQPEPGYEPAVSIITHERHFAADQSKRLFLPSHLRGLAPAGRLDIDSYGLLVFTQDGTIARKIIGEDSGMEKEYLIKIDGELSEEKLRLLNHGLILDGEPLKQADVHWANPGQLRFVLRQGKKRQIRRMCELVGVRVVALKRVRIGQVRLGNLPLGFWRYLAEDESF